MAELGLVPNAVLHLKCNVKPSPTTTEILQSVVDSSGPSFMTYSNLPSSMAAAAIMEGKDSQDSGVGAFSSLSRSLESELELSSSLISSIITSSIAASSPQTSSSHPTSKKKSSRYIPATGPLALPMIPPNLHPAIPPPVQIMFSEDQDTRPSTVITTTSSQG